MKIRQYTAATMQEAILKIKVDLGPDAVILHTRKFKQGGIMGFFAKDMVEVLAAIDAEGKGGGREKGREDKREDKQRERPERFEWTDGEPTRTGARTAARPESRVEGLELGPFAALMADGPARAEEPAAPAVAKLEEPVERVVAAVAEPAPAATAEPDPVPATVTPLVPEATAMLADEVQDLKSTVYDLKEMLGALVGQMEAVPRQAQFPPLLQRVYDKLLACDVDPMIARGLVVYLQREQPHLESYEELVAALEKPLSGLVKTAGPISAVKGEQKIVALVGPTGVGKTTTIAKLAANHALSRDAEMALVTIDTYRVAAIEQLKTYGDIIGLPVEVVLTPQGLKDALRTHQHKDLILIDTAGRSPYNKMHLNELRSFLDTQLARETHLVLSATTRLSDLKRIVKNFTHTGVDRLIFTKTDETDVVGGIISIAHETGLPVSYITTGQSVPDDIMVADAPALARMLIQELKA